MFENLNDNIKSIFLMLLAISGGYVAQTLGCKTQKILTENMYVKHIVVFSLIYFTSSVLSENKHPNKNFINTVTIYSLYLVFTKMSIEFTLGVLFLLAVNYFISTYIKYYESTDIEKEKVKKLKDIQNKLSIISLISILVGFTLYMRKKYNEYGKEFSLKTFIFGVLKCDGLK
jgi:membrane protein insertase Oxa1/YidC/SpoIIIJ